MDRYYYCKLLKKIQEENPSWFSSSFDYTNPRLDDVSDKNSFLKEVLSRGYYYYSQDLYASHFSRGVNFKREIDNSSFITTMRLYFPNIPSTTTTPWYEDIRSDATVTVNVDKIISDIVKKKVQL